MEQIKNYKCSECGKPQNLKDMDDSGDNMKCHCGCSVFLNRQDFRLQIDIKHYGDKTIFMSDGEIIFN